MTDDVYSIPEIIARLKPIFSRYNVKSAILFGSYAKGSQCKHSDVDILVDSGLHGLAFFGLLEEVVTALDKNVDLIDTQQIEPQSRIDCEIKNSGILIYG